jgi:hypothetical protein
MDAKLRAKLKAWDRQERYRATMAMVKAAEADDVAKTKSLLSKFPLLEHWAPEYEADSWSKIAAAAGQLAVMKFWQKRQPESLESLLFAAMGDEYVKSRKGDPVQVAKYLLDQGADVEGDTRDYTPLHRAIFMNRPKLVELLIQRGADASRRYATGESALQIAKRTSKQCAALLEKAGAPLALPKKPERPKPVKTVDLRKDSKTVSAGIEKAVRSFARQHKRETITAIALACVPHEGYVMVSFDTGKFEGSPWDCSYNEFAWVQFPEWIRAHDADAMQCVDLDGRRAQKDPDAFLPLFQKMIVAVLQALEKKGTFKQLTTTPATQIGIEMTVWGKAKFWRLAKGR